MKTIYITIGNSDNKLTQAKWAAFCQTTRECAVMMATEVHFVGYTQSCSAYQTMCICAVVNDDAMSRLREQLSRLAATYRQESIALAIAEVEFVKP